MACLSGCEAENHFIQEENNNGHIENNAKDDVYETEVLKTSKEIEAFRDQPCLVFNILSDSHELYIDDASKLLVNNTYNNIKRVNNISRSNGVVHLGDALFYRDSLYPNWQIVNNLLLDNIRRLKEANDTIFYVMGNHDGLYSKYVDEFETFETIHAFNNDYVIRDSNAPWYYKDYPEVKTRVAFLAVPSRDMVKDGPIRYGISFNQMKWIANTVFDIEDGWRVLFFGHINPISPSFLAKSREVFTKLTDAFILRTSFIEPEWEISVDYSSYTSTTVLAYIAGHAHADAIISDDRIFPEYQLSFPTVIIASCNRLVGGAHAIGFTDPIRKEGTVSEDLWDTLVYRPDLNKLFFIRFGAGDDRVIFYTSDY